MWVPKASIEEKKKTGDVEQLRILWDAYTSVTRPERSLKGEEAIGERKVFSSSDHLEELSGELESLSGVMMSKTRETGLKKAGESLKKVRDMLKEISVKLGTGCTQFVINLALFDFRTAAGGRARKSTSALRQGADEHYARPFENDLPLYVSVLLTAVQGARTPGSTSGSGIVLVPKDKPYIPPTRFTATFPLALKGIKDGAQTLRAPSIPDKDPGSSSIQYAFMGSFGFAEPGYCTWEAGDRSEYPGTRLSLGAYSLNPAYLEDLLSLMGNMSTTERGASAQYGTVGQEHVQALLKKFAGGKGPELAIAWTLQLVDAARALVSEALLKSQVRAPLLRRFFKLMLHKIDVREEKLKEIQKRGALSKATLFEYIWVFEATLWELAFLGASLLTPGEMVVALQQQPCFKPWLPSVGLSEVSLVETVCLGHEQTFERIYFPSGTAAAEGVYEALWALGYGPLPLKVDPTKLSTFTPYFEFYQQKSSMLSPEEVGGRLEKGKGSRRTDFEGTQVWLNLSDGLHSLFVEKRPRLTEVGMELARLLSAYVGTLCQDRETEDKVSTKLGLKLTKLCLVIDYTKFAGDMPNERLYPVLAQLRDALMLLHGVSEVLFLRSNLKYNTGSLDRYQSGEVLAEPKSAVGKVLSVASTNSFSGASEWMLHGEYIPLMKKMYLLSDAIGFAHWKAYSQLWKQG
jgi:hypothetical protein